MRCPVKRKKAGGKKNKRFLFSFLPLVMVHANVPRCSTAGCSFAPVLCIGCDSVVGVSLLVHEGESRAKKPKPLHKTCNEESSRRILSVLLSPHSPCTGTHSCALGGWGKGGLRNIIGTFAPSFSLFFASLLLSLSKRFQTCLPLRREGANPFGSEGLDVAADYFAQTTLNEDDSLKLEVPATPSTDAVRTGTFVF